MNRDPFDLVLPSWPELRELIRSSPKPAIKATAEEWRHGSTLRQATLAYDGDSAWKIDDGDRVEITSDGRTVITSAAGTTAYEGHTASNNWLKAFVDGRRMAYLEQASGSNIGLETVDGRPCWRVQVSGLRRDEDVSFLLTVDAETGIILRSHRIADDDTTFLLLEVTWNAGQKPFTTPQPA